MAPRRSHEGRSSSISRHHQYKANRTKPPNTPRPPKVEIPPHMSEVLSILDSAHNFRPLEAIFRELRDMDVEVTCVEPVLRRTLWRSFMNRLMPKGASSPRHRIHIAFHGTTNENVSKIVKHGFFVPQVANGATGIGHHSSTGGVWGLGIYCSPDVNVVQDFSEDTIIMCAVILGRRHTCQPRRVEAPNKYRNSPLKKGFDSHVTPSKKTWVVFDSSQIVPLCVLHLRSRPKKLERVVVRKIDCWGMQRESVSYRVVTGVKERKLDAICDPKGFKYQTCRGGSGIESDVATERQLSWVNL
jgi:hypothetical protein